jgi:hypothetical protein
MKKNHEKCTKEENKKIPPIGQGEKLLQLYY